MSNPKIEILKVIKDIAYQRGFLSLLPQIEIIKKMIEDKKLFNIALIGRFNSGKSSLLNSIIGKDILPVGVLPVTTVITKVLWAEKDYVCVRFNNGEERYVDFSELKNYLSEELNERNKLGVDIVEIGLRSLVDYKEIAFIDTPGIDSAIHENTDVLVKWLPNVGIAIVVINVEVPLSEQDIRLMADTKRYTPDVIVVLTKVDRLTKEELDQVISFIKNKIKENFDEDISVFPYSIKDGYEKLRTEFLSKAIKPFLVDVDGAKDVVVNHKINSVKEDCIKYLLISKEIASKKKEELDKLKEFVDQQKRYFTMLKRNFELMLAQVSIDVVKKVERDILTYKEKLERELIQLIDDKLSNCSNLLKMVELYNKIVRKFFEKQMAVIYNLEKEKLNALTKEYLLEFFKVSDDFLSKVISMAESSFNIKLPKHTFEVKEPKVPPGDIRISQAFDTHIELLWFLIPTFLFKKLLLKHFKKNVQFEVEKNLTRLAMNISGKISRLVEDGMKQNIKYVERVLSTVENTFATTKDQLSEIELSLSTLADIEKTLAK